MTAEITLSRSNRTSARPAAILTMLLASASLCAVLTAAPIQEPEPPRPPSPSQRPSAETDQPGVQKRAEALVRQLGAEAYGERLAAREALKELGEKARPVLLRAREHKNPEIRLRVRELLARLDEARAGRGEGAGRGLRPFDPKREREQPPFPGGSPEDLLRELERQYQRGQKLGPTLEEMQRELFEQMRRGRPGGLFPPRLNLGPLIGPGPESSVTSVQRTERDGRVTELRVTGEEAVISILERQADGSLKPIAEHRAKTKEELRAKHGELFEDLGERAGRLLRIELGGRSGGLPFGRGNTGREEGSEEPRGERPRRGLRPMEPSERSPRRLERTPSTKRRMLGVLVAPVPTILKAHLRDLPAGAIMIDQVTPGSVAEAMGLRSFDVVVALDGQPVTSRQDFGQRIAAAERPDTVRVSVRRGAERLTLVGRFPSADAGRGR